jgi:hypothetical protein
MPAPDNARLDTNPSARTTLPYLNGPRRQPPISSLYFTVIRRPHPDTARPGRFIQRQRPDLTALAIAESLRSPRRSRRPSVSDSALALRGSAVDLCAVPLAAAATAARWSFNPRATKSHNRRARRWRDRLRMARIMRKSWPSDRRGKSEAVYLTALRISEELITSTETVHVAWRTPATAGERGTWVVSWLPLRLLLRGT